MEISLKEVSKEYKDVIALNKIDLTIPKGMFGILGPNGAGKTTLMKILMALVPADSGEIIINGIPIKDQNKIRECVSYLPQDFSFYPSMRVYETMDYMALLCGIKVASERKERIDELLSKVNMLEHRKKKFKALSGGMKKRLGIAMALLKDPKVLIVDEPTAGLDPDERVRFRNLLVTFAKDRIVVLSTHIVGDIEQTCKNIAIMNKGEIIFCGKRQQIMDEAVGKVRMINVNYEELDDIYSKYYVISVGEISTVTSVKIITDEKIGEEIKPNMEDAYLVKMHSETNDIKVNFKESL